MFDIFYSLHMQRIGQLMHTLSNVFFSLALVKLNIHVFLVGTFLNVPTQKKWGHKQSQILDIKATLEHNLLIKNNDSLSVLNLPVLRHVVM